MPLAGGVSIGLHLFVLPFVVTISVALSDGLFAPADQEWSLLREDQGNGLTSDLVADRDYTLQDIEGYVPQLGRYIQGRPQYIPPSPDYPLERELAYMHQAGAGKEEEKKEQQQPGRPQSLTGAAGSETDDAVIAEITQIMIKLAAVLRTVVDSKTAQAGKSEIKNLYAEMENLANRIKLRDLPPERQAELMEKLWEKCKTQIAGINEQIGRIGQMSGARSALEVQTSNGTVQLRPIAKEP